MSSRDINAVVPLIEKAASNLSMGFEWEKTEQGYQYWADVYNNLVKLVEEQKDNEIV